MEHSFTTNEAAEFLNVTTNTVYQYIKQGILQPCNLEEFKYSREYLFNQDELEKVKTKFEKPGLTTTEVGKLLNVKPHTVFTYIKEEKLLAEKKLYKGRMIYFIQEKDALEFQKTLQQKRKVSRQSFYSKTYGVGLFQLFNHTETREKARIVSLAKKEAILQFEDSRLETIPLPELSKRSIQPTYPIATDLIHRKGVVTFTFPKPRSIHAASYHLIDLLFQQVGSPNMLITEKNEMITVEVKPIKLRLPAEQTDLINLMKQSLVDGKMVEGAQYVRLISPTVPLHIKEIPRSLKEKIKQKAKREHSSMEQTVLYILQEYFKKEL